MRKVVMHRYRYYDPVRRKTFTTGYVLTAEEAADRLPPDAVLLPHTREEREILEPGDDWQANSTSHVYRGPRD